MKYLFEDTNKLSQSINNLDLLFEDGEMTGGELSSKVQRWAQESSHHASFSLKQKISQIIVKIKNLFGIRTFDKSKGNVRVLEDITGFNKLARFIEGTTAYKVANFTPANVVSYSGHINIVNNYLYNKGNRNAQRLQALYDSMKREMSSREAKASTYAASKMKSIYVTNEKQFRAFIVPFIRNMLIATKKLNGMVTKMYKSFGKLVTHMDTIFRKNKMGWSSDNSKYQKSDLMGRCINYVAYANKLLITTCENAIERINRILEQYYNNFVENNN